MMRIKICGLREPENLRDVAALGPDYLGFIFHPGSSRYVGGALSGADVRALPAGIKRVGVFVQPGLEQLASAVRRYGLDYVQLHGDETPAFCAAAAAVAPVIKAFGIPAEGFDFEMTAPYAAHCRYFLFDAKTPGSGQQFDWSLLRSYRGATPFFLAGGLGPDDAAAARDAFRGLPLHALDMNSQLESAPGRKDVGRVRAAVASAHRMSGSAHPMSRSYTVDERGYYGRFGGAYVPEMLYPHVEELRCRYHALLDDPAFQAEFDGLLRDYVGRPTPLYFAERLSTHFNTKIYLKREDLNHTGSHKINNTIGQILVAKRLGKKRIIAETGAGQHGVATATVCARMGLQCVVYMGAVDMERQAPNVARMRLLGAEVVAARSGSQTLKDATNEAIRDWINHPADTHYIIGSVVGPHPYPDMVARFQSVISAETRRQLAVSEGRETPDYALACVGGGSNAAGLFYHYLDDPAVQLVAVEAAGKGLDSGHTAATIARGRPGIIHGSKTLLMQTDDGQITEPYSLSAGLDYPGIGPLHAHLHAEGRARYVSVTDDEALAAAALLCRLEGIIPALESAHALAFLERREAGPDEVTVVNLSGRGDKDLSTYLKHLAL